LKVHVKVGVAVVTQPPLAGAVKVGVLGWVLLFLEK
jgi:hypothetical protein